MNEIENRNNIPSTSRLSKLGISAVGYTAGGLFILLLNTIARSPILGFIVGGIVCLFGIGAFLSKDSTDKKAGFIIMAAGALTILSKIGIPVITAFSGTILGISTFGLLALGIWNGIRFFIGLKKRSQ
jgi:hypothetical protein